MEIRFIWVEEYNQIIENLNVNLQHSGEHKFFYESNKLQMSSNSPSVLDFGNKITGVTAIAGKNGSGKSSICEIIINAAATYVNGGWSWDMSFRGIICYENLIFYSEHLEINNKDDLQQAGYELKAFKESPFERIPQHWRLRLHKESFLYYSNVLDWRGDMHLFNLTNISTQFLVFNDYRRGTGFIPDFGDKEKIPDLLTAHYNEQAYRNIKFYLNFPEIIPFNAPHDLLLKSTYSKNNRFLNREPSGFSEDDFVITNLEVQILDRVYDGDTSEVTESIEEFITINQDTAKQALMSLYRYNLLKLIGDRSLIINFGRVHAFVIGHNDDYDLFSSPEKASQLLKIHQELVSNGNLHDKYKKQDGILSRDKKFSIIEYLYINNTAHNRELLSQFQDFEDQMLNKGSGSIRISNYDFKQSLSAGENSYYTLFARLYDAIKGFDSGSDERENLVLFIDEGEVGFHPAWKKKFLKWIVDFLNMDFNKYKFQIILTTHSPYLLSDLTSDHILLLNRDGDKTKIIPADSFQTFGANINELLADAFFLNDGQIGEFAKLQIQTVIDKLNNWRELKLSTHIKEKLNINEDEKLFCRNIITHIGDDMVRRKLFEMYSELLEEESSIDNEIFFLENRLRQLKERRDK